MTWSVGEIRFCLARTCLEILNLSKNTFMPFSTISFCDFEGGTATNNDQKARVSTQRAILHHAREEP